MFFNQNVQRRYDVYKSVQNQKVFNKRLTLVVNHEVKKYQLDQIDERKKNDHRAPNPTLIFSFNIIQSAMSVDRHECEPL
jgi:hypothetical protein